MDSGFRSALGTEMTEWQRFVRYVSVSEIRPMDDRFNLQRFVDAQDGVYPQVLDELRAGHKRSHWIWFIFPQIEGLGLSPTAKEFAISGRDEAVAYLQHPVLGPRLRACAQLLLDAPERSITTILGSPDDMKFRSMTLFAEVAADKAVFVAALEEFYNGKPDPLTLRKL
jgi:uncharacterized protein (DUF1810 family)